MILHYLTIAYRSFIRNKAYSILNILGLTVGVSCALLIFAFVVDELIYDRYHERGNDIYRLSAAYHLPNNAGFEQYAVTGPGVGEVIGGDFPEIKEVVRIRRNQNVMWEHPASKEKFYETVDAADSNIFKVFTFKFISGNPDNALHDLNTLVVSRRMAEKYFGTADALDKTLRRAGDSVDFKITGVFETLPSNTHFHPDFITSMETYRIASKVSLNNWWMFSFHTYLLLEPNVDIAALGEKVKLISRKYIADQEDGSGYRQEFTLTPLYDIHLHSNLRGEMEANSKAQYVYIFGLVGIFILVMACINFMNLATARAAMRAREIGLRKVAGAIRRQLVFQFLGEALLVTLVAVALSVVVSLLLLPVVNEVSGKNLSLMSSKFFLPGLAAITFFVAILAGSYPSLFLSAFRPSETLKGSFKSSAKGNLLRRGLVVFQFAISVFLIAGTLIIIRQMNFLRSMDLGFSQERIVNVPIRQSGHNGRAGVWAASLKESLERQSSVVSASLSSAVPGHEMGNNVVRLGWAEDAKWSDMRFLSADFDFIKTYQLELVAGRAFDKTYTTDEKEAFMLNESGVSRLGYASAEEAIGQRLAIWGRKGSVIGVLKDFHFMSANTAIEPFIVMMNSPGLVEELSVKVTGPTEAAIAQIRDTYQSIMPDPFEYRFLDEDFDRQYKSEDRFMTLFSFFAATAILIACLGLYGLGMFMSELRFREIGIRKVLGASNSSILTLMTSGFMKLVMVSVVLAIPVSYWAMSLWLESFPYRESIHPMIFVLAAFSALVIALLTVSYQSYRSATTNPVDALRA